MLGCLVFWRFGDLFIVWFDCLVVCLAGSLVVWLVGWLVCLFCRFRLVLFVAALQLDRWPGEKHV